MGYMNLGSIRFLVLGLLIHVCHKPVVPRIIITAGTLGKESQVLGD